jgi:serine/threonine-protein kinase
MGEVYLAEDTELERKVAIKFLPQHLTKDQENVERFKREAKAAASLSHPNIITIYEINEFDGQIFIVMEYVDGKSLRDVINEHELRLEKIISLINQICEGLLQAHKEGIVHRDLKPENIIVGRDGRVRILDFGLAKLKGVSKLTKETSTLGTIHYMPPEQIQGKEVDHRSDIWSLGVLLYEMLTGEVPFQGEYEQAVTYAIMNEEPNISDADVPDKLKNMINNCLQKNPDDRYQEIKGFNYDLKGMGDKSSHDVASKDSTNKRLTYSSIIVSVLILIVLGYWLIPIRDSKKSSHDKQAWENSIAVLPFKDISPAKDQEFFANGVTEQIRANLSNLNRLKVIARTSIMKYKDTDKTEHQIGAELNVANILEGTASRIGNRIRVNAQLVKSEDGAQLWAENYDYNYEMDSIFTIYDDISEKIARKLLATLSPKDTKLIETYRPKSPEAYEAYLQGKFYLYKLTKLNAEKAIQFFHSTLEYQNDYAPAYSGLAEAYNIMSSFGWIPSKNGWIKSKDMAQKALSLDDNLAEAHTMLADVKYIYDWDWEGAEIEFKKAIEINPNYSTGHGWYAVFLSISGRHEEAINEIKLALELDPLFFRAKITAAIVYINARQYENAEEELLELKKLNAELPLVHFRLGLLYLIRNKFEDAIIELEKSMALAKDSTSVPVLAQAYALEGNKLKAKQLLDYWLYSEPKKIDATEVALIYLALGDKDKTFEWLKTAYELRDWHLFRLKVDPRYDPIRNDIRYTDLLYKVGLNP